jgi:hypothetical protein
MNEVMIEFPTTMKVSVSDLVKLINQCDLDFTDDDVVSIVWNYLKVDNLYFELTDCLEDEDDDNLYVNINSGLGSKTELTKIVKDKLKVVRG